MSEAGAKGDFTLYLFYPLYPLDYGNVLLIQNINKMWNKPYLLVTRGLKDRVNGIRKEVGSLSHLDD